jgi:hypothetical protein
MVLRLGTALEDLLDDGCIELDANCVERSIRPIALSRKNSLFAGSDEGGGNWANLASLIETCKRNDVNPQTYFTDLVARLVNGWPQPRIDELMPLASPHIAASIIMPRASRPQNNALMSAFKVLDAEIRRGHTDGVDDRACAREGTEHLDVGDQALIRGLDTALPGCVRGCPYLTSGVERVGHIALDGNSPAVAPPPPVREP